MLGDRATAFFQSQGDRVQGAISREANFGSQSLRGKVRQGRGSLSLAGALTDLSGWSKETQRAVRHFTKLRTDGWVRVDPKLNELTLQWLAAVAPPVVEVIETVFIPIAEHIYDQWPVASGASKSALALSVQRERGELATRFDSFADYTFFIRYAGVRTGRRAGAALVDFEARVLGAIKKRQQQGWSLDAAVAWAADAFNPVSRGSGSDLNDHNKVQAIWGIVSRARGVAQQEKRRTVFRLPNGTDAAGEPVWRRQAVEPFDRAKLTMGARLDAALQRSIDAASRRAA